MKTILLVDDEPHILKYLGEFLEEKLIVIKVGTVKDASYVFETQHLDYIIVDLKLHDGGDFGGIDLILYAIRHKPKARTIILSGYLFEQAREEILRRILKEGILKKDEYEPILEELERNFISKGGPNYIRAVLNKLGEFEGIKKKKCFVIMPMSTSKSCDAVGWKNVFEKIIRPAVEQLCFDYECKYIDPVCGSITCQIIDDLNRSELVIADLTDRNANVTYELGIRYSLNQGDATILISQSLDDVPSDLRDMWTLIYDKEEKDSNKFKADIKAAIEKIEKGAIGTSPVHRYLNPLKHL
jgi:CheY-like chemotaxis protein